MQISDNEDKRVSPAWQKLHMLEKSRLLVPNEKLAQTKVICLNENSQNKIKPSIPYLDLFINASLYHMSIRSRLVSQTKNKLISNSEQLFNATYLLPVTFGVILPPNPRGKNSTNSQSHPGTSDGNKNSNVHTIKILVHNNASVLIARKGVLYKRHKILKDKKNKWSTMAGTFNTTLVTEIILKLSKLNHYGEIYVKCNLTDKLLNYDFILGRDILHKLGIIFNFKNQIIT